MTEDKIESWVERKIDALDKRYLNSTMTQAEYEAELAEIDSLACHLRSNSHGQA